MRILFAISAPISIVLLKGQGKFNTSKGAKLFLATSYDEKYLPIIQEEGFEFKELKIEREIALFKDAKAVFAAIKIIKEVKPDVVNASTPKAGLIFMIACFFTRVKFPIFTLRGLRSATLIGFKGSIVRLTERISCNLAKKVVVIAPSLREYAVDQGVLSRQKAIVIGKGSSNGINTERFNPSSIDSFATQEQKRQWNIPEKGFVFGFVGRIVKEKGIEEMYQAFKEIRNNDTFLVLVGDRETDDAISELIFKEMSEDLQVRFIPFTNAVPLAMSAFDVLVLFSYREGFGNVALEASCMQKPILVSDIIGLKDTVENGITGFAIETKNSTALSLKMDVYRSDKALREEHGKNGRNRVLLYFSADYIHEELYKIYQSGIQ
ncbi:glycosyltransferase [Flavobacterium tegetincola]|uniref:glycosyltransferase n=1 Tax=Flavobacterium tegetincola TaxID=150172 RepID=UPI00040BD00B|nr:glycosyltransferase [Flavobacterium tegetincola]